MQLELFIDETLSLINNMLVSINYTPFYQAVGGVLESAVKSQFQSDGAYFQRGAPWQALAASTVKDRLKHGFDSSSILRRHGGDAGLMGSIHYSLDGNQIILAAAKSYAIFLQIGTKRMPARIFLPDTEFGLPPDLFDSINRMFEVFMSRTIR